MASTLESIGKDVVARIYEKESELRIKEAEYLAVNSTMVTMSYFLKEASKSPIKAANLLSKWREEHDQFIKMMTQKALFIEALSMTKFFVQGLGYFRTPNRDSTKAEEVEMLKEILVGKQVFVRMGNIPEYYPGELKFSEEDGRFYIDRFKDETFYEVTEILDADFYNSILSSIQ